MPPYDRMHWDHPAAPPGTVSLLPDQGGDESAGPVQFVHILGTDTMGRDILTRLIFGARVSLAVGLLTPLIGLIVGGTLGMLAGFYRGALETVVGGDGRRYSCISRDCAAPGDHILSGQGLINIIIALAVLTIPVFIRVARPVP